MGTKVFLSYVHADRSSAEKVARQLESAGLSPWDPSEEIQPGDNWALKLGHALENADALVVLLSPDAVASKYVQREIEYALTSLRYKDRVIPVVVRPTRDVPWILRRFPTFDLRTEADLGGKIAKIVRTPRSAAGARRSSRTSRAAH